MQQPNFFIVGAPKCGTTSIARYLDDHPEIFVAPGEPHFFGSDINYNPSPLSLDEYLAEFARAPREISIIGEKSSWYLMSRRAAEEIYRFDPESKIIIAIRNPVDVIASLHHHLVHQTMREDITDLRAAIDAEPDRREGRGVPVRARFRQHLLYTDVPRFARQIRRFSDLFGWPKIRVVVFDDLIADPAGTYRMLVDFLGADPAYQPSFAVHNRAHTLRSAFINRALDRLRGWKGLRARAPGPVVGLGRHLGTKLREWNTRDVARPEVPSDLRNELAELFVEEVRDLERLLDRDLGSWTLQSG